MRALLIGIVAGAAIAVLLFLVKGTQSVDAELHAKRLDLLQHIADLDKGLDRAVTLETSSALEESRNSRVQVLADMGDALILLTEGPISLKGLSAELDERLADFDMKIGDKFGLTFDFESQTSRGIERLIRSVDSVPFYTAKLVLLAEGDDSLLQLLRSIQYAVTTYGMVANPSEIARTAIDQRISELMERAQTRDEEFQNLAKRLKGSVSDVLIDKNELVKLLNDFLSQPAAESLQQVEGAYLNYHETQVAAAAQYRLYLAVYTAFLLLLLAALGMRLAKSFRDLDKANETLEEQVKERTRDLSTALDDLKESQAQLVQSEKMASLGQMIAGVAHEINTPLGYARSNATIIRGAIQDIRGVCEAQSQALEMINSPTATDDQIGQAMEDAMTLEGQVQAVDLTNELDNLLGHTEFGLTHISELVQSLKDFSRVDRSRSDLYNVNQGIDSTLKLASNHLKDKVQVDLNLTEGLPEIVCSPSQINQVLLNLITNAAQAIDKPDGKITIHTNSVKNGVGIRIVDNGCGMTQDVLDRIFDPFFTTKDVGKGTGLGLSISYKIIEDHHGKIHAKSSPGKGSEFVILLPLKQPKEEGAAASEETMPQPGLAIA